MQAVTSGERRELGLLLPTKTLWPPLLNQVCVELQEKKVVKRNWQRMDTRAAVFHGGDCLPVLCGSSSRRTISNVSKSATVFFIYLIDLVGCFSITCMSLSIPLKTDGVNPFYCSIHKWQLSFGNTSRHSNEHSQTSITVYNSLYKGRLIMWRLWFWGKTMLSTSFMNRNPEFTKRRFRIGKCIIR